MSRGETWWLRSALLISVGFYALSSHLVVANGVLGLLLLAGFAPLRVRADRMAQVALALVMVGVGWWLAVGAAPERDLRAAVTLGAIGLLVSTVLLLIALSRMLMDDPWQGSRGTAALILVALFFLSDGQFGITYPAALILGLISLWAAHVASEPARPGWSSMPSRLRRTLVAGLVIASVLGSAIAISIPRLYGLIAPNIASLFDDVQPGFDTQFQLGAISRMYDSDEIVLRVFGRADYLRGMVYNRYHQGRWLQVGDYEPRPTTLLSDLSSNANVIAIQSVGGDRSRYFLPLDASAISVDGGGSLSDPSGVVFPASGMDANRAYLLPGDRTDPSLTAPDAEDLKVPDAIRRPLEQLASEWTSGREAPVTKLLALEAQLKRTYDYALTFDRTPNVDPVLDFLATHRQGHCEYFASSMALLARSLGIPARVVAGYRVAERNPLGDYYLVRERNAHAWVEAWDEDRGWQTYDPTPAGAMTAQHEQTTPAIAALLDYLRSSAGRLTDALRRLSAAQWVILISLLVCVWLLVRVWRARKRERGRREPSEARYTPPPQMLVALLAELDRRGYARRPSEPLEHYASRLESAGELGSTGIQVAALLRRYAEWRYGAHGDEAPIADAIQEWLQRAA